MRLPLSFIRASQWSPSSCPQVWGARAEANALHPSLPKVQLSSLLLPLGNTKSGYFVWPKNFRPSQYAPPITTSAGKPIPAIGPGAATALARAGSTKTAKPTKAKPAIRIRFMIRSPFMPPRRWLAFLASRAKLSLGAPCGYVQIFNVGMWIALLLWGRWPYIAACCGVCVTHAVGP